MRSKEREREFVARSKESEREKETMKTVLKQKRIKGISSRRFSCQGHW